MSSADFNTDDGNPPPTFLKRFRWPLAVASAAVAGSVWFFSTPPTKNGPSTPKPPTIKTVTLQATPPPPPSPPPPPPPKIQQPQEPKMVEQTPVAEDEPKPEEPKPADDPPAAIGTNIQGDGPPDNFGLSGKGGSGAGGTGRGLGGSGRSASRWGWYAAKVQTAVGDALRRNPRTRDAVLSEKVRVWPDANGRITRAKLADSTGDSALDAAITAALTGVQLPEPPPADMPSPILLRLAARRP